MITRSLSSSDELYVHWSCPGAMVWDWAEEYDFPASDSAWLTDISLHASMSAEEPPAAAAAADEACAPAGAVPFAAPPAVPVFDALEHAEAVITTSATVTTAGRTGTRIG